VRASLRSAPFSPVERGQNGDACQQQKCERHSQEKTDKFTFRALPLQASLPKLADDVGPIFLGRQATAHGRELLLGEGHLSPPCSRGISMKRGFVRRGDLAGKLAGRSLIAL